MVRPVSNQANIMDSLDNLSLDSLDNLNPDCLDITNLDNISLARITTANTISRTINC